MAVTMTVTAVLISILVVLCSFALYLLHRRLTYWKRRGLPHDEPTWMLGNMKGVKTKHHEQDIVLDYYKKYKGKAPFVGFYYFQAPVAFITDLDLIKNIMIKDFSNFADRTAYYNEKDDPLTGNLFNIANPKWRQLRQKLSATFTSSKMKFMYPTVHKVGEQFMLEMDKMAGSTSSVDIKEMFGRFTTDVIGTCAFGLECSSLSNPNAEFRVYGRRFFEEWDPLSAKLSFCNAFPKIGRMLGVTLVPKDIAQFFMQAVKDTVEIREKNHIRRNDFMDMMIELKNKGEDGLTINEVAAQAFIFYLAGFETSSTTSTFALYELAMNPDIQDKVRQEIDQVLVKHNNEFTYESISEMVYLNQVLYETLRLHAVSPILFRKTKEDYPVPGNHKYVIEQGTVILLPVIGVHLDPEIYPNPTKFNPDNFTAEKMKERESITWLGFGEGPRNCIGLRFGKMQAQLGLAMLLRKFKFSINSDTQIPPPLDKHLNIATCTAGGVMLKVERVE